MTTQDHTSFEVAYERLEIILEELNTGELALEKSLTLYEEADKLITYCTQKLENAERKIRMLVKNREGGVTVDANGDPEVVAFSRPSHYESG
ncbi:MAG: exodeoxyribonuclease VII small subunit [Simkaniaceae bacterium]|nr:exodeoxyribonuclease VII small subunit [Simkaniaceae bacterium]